MQTRTTSSRRWPDKRNGRRHQRRSHGNRPVCSRFRSPLPSPPPFRHASARHASENLNFREAVIRFRALCYESTNKKPPKPAPGAGARRAPNGTTAAAVAVAGGPCGEGEGGGGCGVEQGAVAASPASPAPSSTAGMAAAASAAARDIVNRFVREGAPEQVQQYALLALQ